MWFDEFNGADGSRPDRTKWVYDIGSERWGNQEQECYTDRPDNSVVRGGNLVIIARKENIRCSAGPDNDYTSARLKSEGLFSQTYGRFEARIKIPRGQGMWPAFWMLGDDISKIGWYDPPLEVVHIPFEGKEIIAYLRLPKNPKGPVPLVIAINGLDSRKEDLTESFSAILPFGIGYLAVDGPGTGQNPIKVSPSADRILSKVIDYAQSRPEVDKNRIAMHGVSWGAYWATKMAIVERSRLRGCSAQSPPIDKFFQKDFLMNSLLGNREYLFDQVPALMNILEGVHTLDEMAEYLPKLSLVQEGLLGKPMAPMLVIAGVLDTQVPISDEYLLLSNGDVPKDAWINPKGGHLGRQVGVWPDPLIFKQVIIPWLVKTLQPAG